MFVEAGAQVVFSYQKAGRKRKNSSRMWRENCAAVAVQSAGAPNAKNLVEATVTRFGRLDILVANHGVWAGEDVPVDAMTDEQWRQTVAINLDAVFGLVKHSVRK